MRVHPQDPTDRFDKLLLAVWCDGVQRFRLAPTKRYLPDCSSQEGLRTGATPNHYAPCKG